MHTAFSTNGVGSGPTHDLYRMTHFAIVSYKCVMHVVRWVSDTWELNELLLVVGMVQNLSDVVFSYGTCIHTFQLSDNGCSCL